MNINLILNSVPFFIFIMVIHFLADFGLQTHKQAIGKSKEWIPLLQHTGVYSFIFFIVMYTWYANWIMCFLFAVITFITHTATDYFTSRISNRFFTADDNSNTDYHNGFVVIGFDQMLHYLQLWFTHIFILMLFQ